MGIFDKLLNTQTEKVNKTNQTSNKNTVEKDKLDLINSFSDEFEYNPLEDQVRFNIVQNPQTENSFLIIMELYEKGIDVYDKNSMPKNELILEYIESISNDVKLNSNNADMIDLARFCKKISTDINEFVNESMLKDDSKLKEISKHFSTIPSNNSKFRNKFKFIDTIDGKAFNSKTKNSKYYDKFDHSEDQYESLKDGEFVKYDLKGSISLRKNLKRIFNNDKNFCEISETPRKSWQDEVEQNPPIISENSSQEKSQEISQDLNI